MLNSVVHGDFRDFLSDLPENHIFIFDPPYNQGYKYDEYNDKLSDEDYEGLLRAIPGPKVCIHYPEQTINILPKLWGKCSEVVTWHYSIRNPKHFRLVSWWGCKPDFKKVREPYAPATLKDKRNQHKIKDGRAITDVWEIPYINNMNKEKTNHPCQIPQKVMDRIILTTCSKEQCIVDPFAGSGTTLLSAKNNGFNYIGFDISKNYCDITRTRLGNN